MKVEAIVKGDDDVRRRAAGALARAGIAVRAPSEASGGAILVLALAGREDARLDAIRSAADLSTATSIVATLPDAAGNAVLRRALSAGAAGIVLDSELERALVPSIRAVLAGQLAVPARLRRRLAPRHLSHREKQVLALVVRGYTNRQIADALILAESTVKTHLSSTFAKLDARSRAEAVARVLDPDEGPALQLIDVAPPPVPHATA